MCDEKAMIDTPGKWEPLLPSQGTMVLAFAAALSAVRSPFASPRHLRDIYCSWYYLPPVHPSPLSLPALSWWRLGREVAAPELLEPGRGSPQAESTEQKCQRLYY